MRYLPVNLGDSNIDVCMYCISCALMSVNVKYVCCSIAELLVTSVFCDLHFFVFHIHPCLLELNALNKECAI